MGVSFLPQVYLGKLLSKLSKSVSQIIKPPEDETNTNFMNHLPIIE